jgi:uncharacterized repeat protein (TIGR01451 family)
MYTAIRTFVIVSIMTILVGTAWGSTLTINKSNDAPGAGIKSGIQYTYTIGYNWSGGIPTDSTLVIQDLVPSSLIVLATSPATAIISGNLVTYTVTGITASAGSGVLQIIVEFPAGTTCPQTSACDTARIEQGRIGTGNPTWVYSNPSCATALATNNWTFDNVLYAGCAACAGNDIIFRVDVMNLAGYYGGLNLNPITLTYSFPLASGAVITSVSAGYPWNAATGIGTNSITVTNSAPLSVYSYWNTIYIHVSFPCRDTNQTEVATANWSFGTVCNPKPFSVTDTASVKICAPVTTGNLYKYFYEPTYDPYNPYFYPNKITPGCCGTYAIQYSNTGSVSQTGVVITDTLPGYMNVSQIYTVVPAGMTSVKEEAYVYTTYPSGSWVTIQAARTVSGYDPITSTVSKIRWTYTGSLPIATSITNTIDVCVRTTNYKTGAAVVAGQIMRDTAVVQVTGIAPYMYIAIDTVSVAAPQLIAEKSFIGKCNGGASPNGPWYPGDVVRFRMAVANLGSAPTTSATTITDLLPAGFSYVGNETYYWGPILPPGNWLSPWAPDCATDFGPYTATINSALGGALTSPSLGATNCIWTFPTLPSQCNGTPMYFMIEFDVLIDTIPPTLPGTYANNFKIGASNATTAISNNAYVVVSSKPGVTALKQVRSGNSGAWSNAATIPPGSSGQYLLTVTNTGNVPISNLCILDILPHVGDIGILPPYAARNSAFPLPLTTALSSIAPAGFSPSYYAGIPATLSGTVNPSRTGVCSGFCGVTNPAGTTSGVWAGGLPTYGTYSFSVSAGSSVTLAPGASLKVIVPFTVPDTAKVGTTACNSFAYQCYPTGSPSTCLDAEPTEVCVTVGKDTSSGACCPCDTIGVTPSDYSNIQVQWKTFTIYHLHVCSPITTITIKYLDCNTGLQVPNLAYVNGGNVHVYRNTPPTNTLLPYCAFNISDNYQLIPITGCLTGNVLPTYGTPPSQDRVSFDLGLNYGVTPPTWCIHVTIHYADGDSCVDTIPGWTPKQPGNGTGVGSGTMTGVGTVYAVPIKIDPSQFQKTNLGFVTASVTDTSDAIIGGSGGIWESQVDSIPLARPQSFVQNKHTALFHLAPSTQGAVSSPMQFYIFVSHHGDTANKPVIRLGLYDDQANLLSTDSVRASSNVSTVSHLPGIAEPTSYIEINSIQPNPARNTIDVTYTLGANEEATLSMFNPLGVQVGVLADGFQTQGQHVAHFVVSGLVEGSYYLRLSTTSGQTSAGVRIVH